MIDARCSHGLSGKCRQCFEEGMAAEALIATKERKPKSLKPKKCKEATCRKSFIPKNSMHVVCSGLCAQLHAKACRVKKERKETRKRLDAIATLPELKKKAQMAINCFVRTRDASKDCISCRRPLSTGGVGGGFDAGHLRSVGSAAHLRFDIRNINGQCKHCNNYLSGNPHGYRLGYIERFGADALAELEADNMPRNYTRQELVELAAHYRAKAREMSK